MIPQSIPLPGGKFRLKLEKRLTPSPTMTLLVPVISIVLALLTGALFLYISGIDPFAIYYKMFSRAFATSYGLSETVVKSIPLMLTGIGVAVAFKMQLWNIGGEGQLYIGALAATWVALNFTSQPAYVLIPFMAAAGCIGGALWGLIPAIPRAYLQVNEIITTLMLNYVGILLVDYFVFGPWRDPEGYNFPFTAPFVEAAYLPTLFNTRIHAGLFMGLALAVIIYILFNKTRLGYEIRVIGESPSAARYAGMNIKRNIIVTMLISGAICGLAGMSEVSGVIHRLQHGLSPGYGYTAIIIAWLAKLNPFAIIMVAFLFGGLQVGGFIVQTSGLPASGVSMLQGLILFFVLGTEFITYYKISLGGRKS